jgi:type I restriction enzyme S subunit
MSERSERWEKRRLGEVLEVQNGYAFDSEKFSDQRGVPLVRIRDLKDGTRTETLFDGPYDPRYLVNAGDYLVGMDGNFGCYQWKGPQALLNQRVCRLVFTSEAVDPYFVYFGISAHLEEIERQTSYATVKHLSSKQVKSIEMKFPSIDEQRRIVARIKECMERIDEIGALSEELSREANALLPSSLSTLFGDLASRRQSIELGQIIAESRYGTSAKCIAPDTAIPVVRIPNIVEGRVVFQDLKYCDLGRPELARLALVAGDILVVRTNGSPDLVGRCAVFRGSDRPIAYASYLIRLRLDRQKANADYVSYFLRSTLGRDAIEKIKRTSAGQYNINSENLRGISLPLPSLAEQQAIAARLGEQEAAVKAISAEYETRTAESAHMRGAVLRKAFAGDL